MTIMPFDFLNPRPDDLYETVDDLLKQAFKSKRVEIMQSVGVLSDRDYQLVSRQFKNLRSTLAQIATNASKYNDCVIELNVDIVKYYSHGDASKGNEGYLGEWVNEIVLKAIWLE